MKLTDIIQRHAIPEPWAEGEKIPWNEPGFSKRMLKEHLSQAHDAASRRSEIIDRHVGWIHDHCLKGKPARVLDLGCGPGLYSSRLARMGHTCTGIDFSPASIAYAREQARQPVLSCQYVQADIRHVDYGEGYEFAMLIFGEFNTFQLIDARRILEKAHAALVGGGLLLLEPHTFEAVREIGLAPPNWHSREKGQGLFSEEAHLLLQENFWDEARQAATKRYYVIDANSGEVQRHAASMQAYRDADYRRLLETCDFQEITTYPSLTGRAEEAHPGLYVITARK